MADQKSDQITNLDAVPKVKNAARDAYGRIRTVYFEKTLTSNLAIGEILELCEIPRGARIIGGHVAWEAMTTGASAATGSIGITGTVAKYLEATDMDAAGSSGFADTIVRNYGAIVADLERLILTVSVEAFASGQKIAGHVKIAMD